MEINKIYKHKSCIDVAFQIESMNDKEDKLELTGTWINVFYKFKIVEDEVIINKKDLNNWKEISL